MPRTKKKEKKENKTGKCVTSFPLVKMMHTNEQWPNKKERKRKRRKIYIFNSYKQYLHQLNASFPFISDIYTTTTLYFPPVFHYQRLSRHHMKFICGDFSVLLFLLLFLTLFLLLQNHCLGLDAHDNNNTHVYFSKLRS